MNEEFKVPKTWADLLALAPGLASAESVARCAPPTYDADIAMRDAMESQIGWMRWSRENSEADEWLRTSDAWNLAWRHLHDIRLSTMKRRRKSSKEKT